jgi:AAA15 family ATPase/GTPase
LEKSQLKETVINDVLFAKNRYDEKGEVDGTVLMRLNEESDGTKKFYSFIGELQEKFDKGGLYICDEIDSNFHPTLLQRLIHLFNNPFINKANAQLFFTSHDTNLMNPAIMRRDQFYFTEKSERDETFLYSLSDLKGIRNNADFARQYLAGFYGALPVLGSYLEKDNSALNPQN